MDKDLAQAIESPEAIVRSIFPDLDAPPLELPTREGKSYALTAAQFKQHSSQIIKTIAGIANRTADTGYIICLGTEYEEPQVDAAIIDDAVRASVFPHVLFDVARHSVAGRVVDLIRIQNTNRPHLMRNSGNELVLQFRGAANNVTAGRHELDAIYEQRQITSLRRELQRLRDPDADTVQDFLAENDWGGLSETSDPEFLYAIVPKIQKQTPLAHFVAAPDVHNKVHMAYTEVLAAEGDSDWLGSGGLVTGPRDGYLEVYQTARDNHRIGTIRIYDTGAIIVRIWILEPLFAEEPIYSFNHFKTALRASMRFSWRIYRSATFPAGDAEIRCALVNAEDLNLWVPPNNPRLILPNRDVGRRLYLPKRPISVAPESLDAQSTDIADQVARALKTHYGG